MVHSDKHDEMSNLVVQNCPESVVLESSAKPRTTDIQLWLLESGQCTLDNYEDI